MGALVARHEQQRERLHVDFNANNNPIGKEEDKFISYIGYLARSKVHIVYSDWWMMAEELEKRKEVAKSDPSIIVQAPDPPLRYQKWKAARLKGDKYINPVVAEVAAKISNQGSFMPSHRMDILSTTIGKLDNTGYFRGEPRGVGVGKYFGRKSHCCSHDHPSPELLAKVRAELLGDIMKQVSGEVASMVQSSMERTTQDSPAVSSTKDSYNPSKDEHHAARFPFLERLQQVYSDIKEIFM
ncbi:hypothetical protein K1719_043716 [Acacia pycnantha]|nr:hypothetical protein K1719_043716 [Acacia pycnantha]